MTSKKSFNQIQQIQGTFTEHSALQGITLK